MQTLVNVPDSLYEKSEALAAQCGATLEQFIVEAIAKEVRERTTEGFGNAEVSLPVIRSAKPGALDLSAFDFDDLLT